MINPAEVASTLDALSDYLTSLVENTSGKGSAAQVGDTQKVNNKDLNSFLQDISLALSAHLDAVNPHGTTPAQLGTYSMLELDNLLAQKINPDRMQMSFWANFDGTGVNLGISGWKVTIPAYPLFISGKYFEMPITVLDVEAAFTNHANTTFYIYAQYTAALANYVLSTVALTESTTLMYLAKIVTGASAVTSAVGAPVARLATYRVSALPLGSAIPASTGVNSAPGALDPAWN